MEQQPLVSVDESGNIDKSFYYNSSLDIITREANEKGLDLNRLNANQLKSLLRRCYYSLFEAKKRPCCNNSSIIPYTEKNIDTLLSIYLDICEMFTCIPSLYGFERYTGITEETTQKYVTSARLELLKSRKDFIQNSLSATPVGQIALANNDSDTGLMYNRQNILDHETVKQGLTVQDFVQISQRED